MSRVSSAYKKAYLLLILGISASAAVLIKMYYSPVLCSLAPKTATKSVWTPPRIYLLYDHTIYHVFEDWVEPFLLALGAVTEIFKVSVSTTSGTQSYKAILRTTLLPGDTVLLLQSTHDIQRQNGVAYWLLNTEGPDKNFSEHALSKGYKHIIDYSLFNVERHKLGGAETSLWLPLIGSHSITHHIPREKLCMVGGVNTARRKEFVEKFDEVVQTRELNISIDHTIGWGHTRDYSSQMCALVVNVASVENNHATPRLRIDKLWHFDIPIISEEMSGSDPSEYNGTVAFAPYSKLPQETADLWERIVHRQHKTMTESLNARVLVHESRLQQFQVVVQAVVRGAFTTSALVQK